MGTHVVVGLSHREARLEQLERYWVPPALREQMAQTMLARGCAEALVLSTCARTELHAIVEPVKPFTLADVVVMLVDVLEAHGRDRAGEDSAGRGWLHAHAFSATGDAATTHLFRVAAGLNSRVLGEREIRTQIHSAACAAVAAAHNEPDNGPHQLRALTAAAIGAARRVQAEASGPDTRVFARRAVDLALADAGPGRAHATVAVVGAGTMGRQILDLVCQRGLLPHRVTRGDVRDPGRTGDQDSWPPLGTALRTSDIVVFATSAQQRVLTRHAMETIMRERAGRPITVLDLALPRNVAPAVRELPNLRLVDLDDVQGRDDRRSIDHTAQAHAVDELAARYCRAVRARRAGPLIAELRHQLEQSCKEELRRHVGAHTVSEDFLCRTATAIAGTIAHAPTVLARDAAADDDSETLDLLARAFNLRPATLPTTMSSPPPRVRNRRPPRWLLDRAKPAL